MRTTFIPLLLLTASASAQFAGGHGRGDVPIAFSGYAPWPSLGGTGRGDAQLVIAGSAPSPYLGGNGRGDALIAFNANAASPFLGGNGRGDVKLAFAGNAASPFLGGNGRGDVQLVFMGNAASQFAGGAGRGEVQLAFGASELLLALRGMLEGPYVASTGLMSDALRVAGLLPASEPYSALGYAQPGIAGATSAPGVLATTGTNAIVDWVVVELRDPVTPATVLSSRPAFLQRDGDIVAMDGVSPLTFNRPPDNYHVVLRHRNHLGVMTQSAVPIGLSTTPYDLSVATLSTYGTNARKSITGTFPAQVLWAGDVNFNNQLKYAGSNNDRDPILTAIGGSIPTNTLSGQYRKEDINMNGQVKYAGSANDRDILLQNIGGSVPTATRNAQLP